MLITTIKEFERSLKSFTKELVVDVETNGLDLWNTHKLCGVGICTSNEETFYYPFRHRTDNSGLLSLVEDHEDNNLPMELLTDLWSAMHEQDTIIGHNIKFDLAAMYQDGFDPLHTQTIEDTLSLARLYFKEKYDRLTLGNCAANLLSTESGLDWKDGIKQVMKHYDIDSFDLIPLEYVSKYCEQDCLVTWKVRNKLWEYIEESDQMKVALQERDLTQVLWNMEREGLLFDKEYCLKSIPKLESKKQELANKIYATAKCEFDILSNTQLTKVMDSLGIKSPFISNAGKEQWGTDVLLSIDSEIGSLILEYRGVAKMLSTYFEPLLKWVDNRQHPSFKSAGAVTGRMSCQNPNLQNLGHKSIQMESTGEFNQEAVDALKARLGTHGKGGEVTGAAMGSGTFSNIISTTVRYEDNENSVSIRRLYVAPEGYKMIAIDYSQMEMRVFSDYVKDESMGDLLNDSSFDFHGFVASQVWGVNEESSLWKFYRTLAKAINFGMLYGIGDGKLAQQIQKTKEEALVYKTNYFKRFPNAKKFMDDVKGAVYSRGWIKNRFDRKYFISYERAYTGVNYLIQGTSADVVKNRMIACHNYLLDKKSKLIVQIHDELVFYVHDSEMLTVPKELKRILEDAVLDSPLPVDVSICDPSWAQKGDLCLECGTKITKLEGEKTCKC